MIWRSLKPTFFQLFRLTTGRRNRLRASAEISEKFSEKFFTAWKPNLLAPHFILFQRHLSVPYSLAPRPAAELARPPYSGLSCHKILTDYDVVSTG